MALSSLRLLVLVAVGFSLALAKTTTSRAPAVIAKTTTTRSKIETTFGTEEGLRARVESSTQELQPANAALPPQTSEHKPVPEAGHIQDCKDSLNCACPAGYTHDSQSFKCRPLCNGKIYGCIGGTCVGVNQCRCEEDKYLANGEFFHCKAGHSYWKWPLLLLLIPAGLIVVSFCVVTRRLSAAKAYHWSAKGFQEERLNRSRGPDDGEPSIGKCSIIPLIHRPFDSA